jgi:glyceraldehyde-3-phosphate dehydrogenase/erythrose-4-phosphate dehydrogenase
MGSPMLGNEWGYSCRLVDLTSKVVASLPVGAAR